MTMITTTTTKKKRECCPLKRKMTKSKVEINEQREKNHTK
jgi:hypothetical protein